MKLFFSILFFVGFAKADFSGDWTGVGFISSAHSRQKCADLWLSVQQTATELNLLTTTYPCILVQINNLAYEINASDLYLGAEKVGWIKKTEFYINAVYPNGVRVETHGKIKNNILTFSQDIIDKKTPWELHVKAHFERFVPPSP